MRPEIMTSIQLARWLYSNQGLYRNKSALDMGCGSGIQGVVMAIFGSKKVVLSDVSKDAVANSKENIKKYELENQCTVFESDLFENIEVSFDIIVFNHPFFGDIYKSGEEAAIEMLGGKTNNPELQGPKHDYKIKEVLRKDIKEGLQQGLVSIYEITL